MCEAGVLVVNNDFTNLSLLLKSGYNATKACNSSTQVIIHTANSDSDAHARWFYDGIRAKGVTWDITALSYYCNWHGTMADMTSVIADMISRYGKPTILAETATPFTTNNADSTGNSINTACPGYPATWAGQAAAFTAVQNAAKAGGAVGVFYWDGGGCRPTATTGNRSSGSLRLRPPGPRPSACSTSRPGRRPAGRRRGTAAAAPRSAPTPPAGRRDSPGRTCSPAR